MRQAILHHYRRERRHQMDTYGGATVDPSGRVEYTGGGAAYGQHAYAAYLSAKRHLYFVTDLEKTISAHKKRSAASRRGWKTRRIA